MIAYLIFKLFLDFKFPNIMLPDSASNPAGSQGFVQYRIKPKANLPLGTQIENTAHIYFDYNAAITTSAFEGLKSVEIIEKIYKAARYSAGMS